MKETVTYKDIRGNKEINQLIEKGNEILGVLGYTEHSKKHAAKVAETAAKILKDLGYGSHEMELARIAGYMHDIGNVVNRIDHAQSGAVMAFRLLDHIGMEPNEIALVVSAIGNHDESTAAAVNPIAAALILADKTDVRRSRVRNPNPASFDIHDRVNFAVKKSSLYFNENKTAIILDLEIDTEISPVIEYFEIFLNRMLLCKRACSYLGLQFKMIVNGSSLL